MTDKARAIVALVALIATIAAVVALTITGHDAGQLLGWLGPIVTGLWAVGEVRSAKTTQAKVLSRIDENVNGKLDARIVSAVHNALDERAVQDARIERASAALAAERDPEVY